MKRENSRQIYEASCAVIPGGVNSPARAFRGLDLVPLVVERGKGDTLWDVDENPYVDFCCSWGALILGHAHKAICLAVKEQMDKGSSFGAATAIEQKLAALVASIVPSIEKIRFVSSGTEAAMSALRLARGYTGRSRIVKFNGNYHGHTDSLLIQAGSGLSDLNPAASSLGIPEDMIKHTISLPFNDLEVCRAYLRAYAAEIAAVIVEPIAGNMGVVPADLAFLHMLREETEVAGSVLIFDEVITGFRVGLQGAQGLYGIIPDLTCFAKILGGGFPAAAFGGKKEIMDHLAPLGEVYQAGTLSGNPIAMQAGLATLLEVQKEGFYTDLQAKTDAFLAPIKKTIKKGKLRACVQGVGSMFTLFLGTEKVTAKQHLDQKMFNKFFTCLFEQGIYIPPSPYEAWFISAAHTKKNLEKSGSIIAKALKTIL